jgi:hypothetical protein
MTEEFFKWFDSYPPGVDVIDSFALYDEKINVLFLAL